MGEGGALAAALAEGNNKAIAVLREKIGVTCGAVLYPLLDKVREHGDEEMSIRKANGLMNAALTAVTNGAFQPAIDLFTNAHHVALLGSVNVSNGEEKEAALRIVNTCRVYVAALRLNIQRKTTEPPRSLEMAALFAHFRLVPVHHLMACRAAMTAFYNAKKFSGAAYFAEIVRDSYPGNSVENRNARIILQEAAANPDVDNSVTYTFPPDTNVCGVTYAIIPRGDPYVTCPVCNQAASPEYKNMVCPTCCVAHYV